MSRYTLPSHDPRHEVIIGWDNPLQTFFVQVCARETPEEDDALLVWEGGRPREVQTLGAIVWVASHWARVPPAIADALAADQQESPPPSGLQRQMWGLMDQR